MASDLHAKVYDVLAAYTGLSDTRNEHIAGRVAAALEADLSAAEAAAAREAVERCAARVAHMPANRWDGDPCQMIRALAPPPPGALDRVRQAARAEGMEAAAALVDAKRREVITHPGTGAWMADVLKERAAAIRAAKDQPA